MMNYRNNEQRNAVARKICLLANIDANFADGACYVGGQLVHAADAAKNTNDAKRTMHLIAMRLAGCVTPTLDFTAMVQLPAAALDTLVALFNAGRSPDAHTALDAWLEGA